MANTQTGNFPIGFRCNCKWQADVSATIEYAKAQQFEFIDRRTATMDELDMITSAGLRIGSIDLPQPWRDLTSPDAGVRAAMVDSTAEYVSDVVGRVGPIPFFACAFPNTDDAPRQESFALVVEAYGSLCEKIAPTGATIALEGYPGPWPYYPTHACTPSECRALIKEVRSPALGFTYDPSHLIRMGIEPFRFLEEFIDRVYHVHGKDTELFSDDLYEFGHMQSPPHVKPHGYGGHCWRYTIPGSGCAPWKKIMSKLESAKYAGIVSIELEDENFNGDPEREKEGFVNSRDYLATV